MTINSHQISRAFYMWYSYLYKSQPENDQSKIWYVNQILHSFWSYASDVAPDHSTGPSFAHYRQFY